MDSVEGHTLSYTNMQYLFWVFTLRDLYTYNVPVATWSFMALKAPAHSAIPPI